MIAPVEYTMDTNGLKVVNLDIESGNGYANKPEVDTNPKVTAAAALRDKYQCSAEEKRSGLCRLLKIQMAFGVSYCGNCPIFNSYVLKKAILISYDCIVIISFALFEYFAFSNDVFSRLFNKATNKGIMSILFGFAAFSMAMEFFAIKTLLLKNGWDLITVLRSIGKMCNRGILSISQFQTRLIDIFLILMAITFAFLLPINYTSLDQSMTSVYSEEKLKTIGFFIVGLFYGMNKFSITSLMLFTAFAIKKLISDWTKGLQTNTIKIQTLCENVLTLRTLLETTNDQLGMIMLIKVFVNAMFMSSTVCSMSVGFLPYNAIIGITGFTVTSILDIVFLCYSSQIMINSMAALCKQVEKTLITDGVYGDNGTDHYKQLNVILSMKDSIRLKL
ncbi:unnamed protein product, partial [Medioppia subpectinata]